MKKLFYLLAVILLVSCVDKGHEDDNQKPQPTNVIYYRSEGGEIIEPNNKKFGAGYIVSNTYEGGLGKITFSKDVTKIGDFAFCACQDLTRISIPNTATLIDEYAFAACTSLLEVVIGSGVKDIGRYAFRDCYHLHKINIPESVTSIKNYAFWNCSLSEINLPSKLTSIGDEAFSGTPITSITIPDSVVEIGNGVFCNCYDLSAFYGKFASEDNRCLIVDGVLNSFAPKGLASYTITDSVTKIGVRAFESCDKLESVTIPDGVIKIEMGAFYGCESLKTVYCKGTTPPFLDVDIFDDTPSLDAIYVPMNSVDAYKLAWSPYAELIVGYYL